MASENGWKLLQLGDVCKKIGSGATPRGGKESYGSEGIALIRSQNVYNEGFSRSGLAFINDEQAKKLENVVVEENDVLLNITGESVCRVCQVPNDVLPARVNQHVTIIRPKGEFLDATFLRYQLLTPSMQVYMNALSSAGATRRALTKGMIEAFEIQAPSIAEQKAIAGILGALDDKIELNRRMNDTLEAMARAIFKSWFVDYDPVRAKLDGRQPPGMDADTAAMFPDHFDHVSGEPVPKSWPVKRWGDIATLEYGKSLRDYKDATGPYRVFGTNGPIGFHTESLCGSAGIIIGRKGAYRGVHYSPKPFFVIDTAFYLKPKVDFDQKWAYYELLRFDINSMDSGSAIPSTSRDDFYSIPVCLPSADVLRAFGRMLKPLDKLKQANEHKVETLAATRDALLPKLLSGEIRVSDAEVIMEGVIQ